MKPMYICFAALSTMLSKGLQKPNFGFKKTPPPQAKRQSHAAQPLNCRSQRKPTKPNTKIAQPKPTRGDSSSEAGCWPSRTHHKAATKHRSPVSESSEIATELRSPSYFADFAKNDNVKSCFLIGFRQNGRKPLEIAPQLWIQLKFWGWAPKGHH